MGVFASKLVVLFGIAGLLIPELPFSTVQVDLPRLVNKFMIVGKIGQ